MITGRDNILGWFAAQDCPYFDVFKRGKEADGNRFWTNRDKGAEQSMADATDSLRQCLQFISTGDFKIVCNDKETAQSKGRKEAFFSIPANESTASSSSSVNGFVPAGYVSKVEAEQIASDKFKQMMAEKELADVKAKLAEVQKENKELQQKAESGWNKLLNGIGPHIGDIFGEWFPKKAAPVLVPSVHGPGDDNVTDNKIDEQYSPEQVAQMQQTLQAFAEALAEKYPDNWLEIIVKLTHTIKESPDKIDMALKFL